MIVMQINAVRLKPGMDAVLTARAFNNVQEWLKQWTCRGNFPAVIADTREAALDRCRAKIARSLVPTWLADQGVMPEAFQFEVAFDEVVNGEFWSSLGNVWCRWHSVEAP